MTFAYPIDAPPAPRVELCAKLRAATARAHEELEYGLALLSRVSDRQWFQHVLERFFGFHAVWESAMREHGPIRAFQEPRSRLPHLRRDLAALGRTTAELTRLDLCDDARDLVRDPAEAVGSIYVLEGSTLGGQVISRALANADWPPAGGISYFHPYGARTGVQWRRFRAFADAQVGPADEGRAAAGAERTFHLLNRWLTA